MRRKKLELPYKTTLYLEFINSLFARACVFGLSCICARKGISQLLIT